MLPFSTLMQWRLLKQYDLTHTSHQKVGCLSVNLCCLICLTNFRTDLQDKYASSVFYNIAKCSHTAKHMQQCILSTTTKTKIFVDENGINDDKNSVVFINETKTTLKCNLLAMTRTKNSNNFVDKTKILYVNIES